MDAGLPITAGTWTAVQDSADESLTGAQLLASGLDKAFFALCRPPDHHATHDYIGGYRHLNNTAIAAQYLLDSGCKKAVTYLDCLYGNGSQSIFIIEEICCLLLCVANRRWNTSHFLGCANELAEGADLGLSITTRCPMAQIGPTMPLPEPMPARKLQPMCLMHLVLKSKHQKCLQANKNLLEQLLKS